MISIVDYKVGNIRSVKFAMQRIGADAMLTSDVSQLHASQGIILPGVGAFSLAMEELRKRKLVQPITDMVRAGKPLLGICVGHQLLFSESEEYGRHEGLNLIPGKVRRFEPGIKIPHMGWNQVILKKNSILFDDIKEREFFYFAHSFSTEPTDESVVLGETEYGKRFTSCVQAENIFGLQFHPEKSSNQGESLLKNFCRYCKNPNTT